MPEDEVELGRHHSEPIKIGSEVEESISKRDPSKNIDDEEDASLLTVEEGGVTGPSNSFSNRSVNSVHSAPVVDVHSDIYAGEDLGSRKTSTSQVSGQSGGQDSQTSKQSVIDRSRCNTFLPWEIIDDDQQKGMAVFALGMCLWLAYSIALITIHVMRRDDPALSVKSV
eukprot:UN27957